MTPAGGIISRTARVSVVRQNLKEAAGPAWRDWSDEQEAHTRRTRWMRRQISSKSNTCTESVVVDVTDISVKVSVHYPGRSAVRP
jgi:hypothetical protein